MTSPAYPAARVVAPKVHAHFVRHVAEAQHRGDSLLATVPDTDAIETIIEAAFWASLRREETYVPKISLAYLSPDQSAQPMLCEKGLSLDPWRLAKVRP